ncbi:MAG: response regulator [Vicinamibacterales bacterium]
MPRILVVEDEAHIADGLRFNLEADGHAVDVDGDGDIALTRLLGSRGAYDAVILDVMLPGQDGFQVVRALRDAGEYVPVLMLTARGRPETSSRASNRGPTTTCRNPSSWPSCWRASAGCCGAASGPAQARTNRTPHTCCGCRTARSISTPWSFASAARPTS